MSGRSRSTVCRLGAILLSPPSLAVAQQPGDVEREDAYRCLWAFSSLVRGGRVEPRWMEDGDSFWYVDSTPPGSVIWVVDPVANSKEPLLDTGRVRVALAEVLDDELPSRGLPFDSFAFVDETRRTIRLELDSRAFVVDRESYAVEEMTRGGEQQTRAPDPRPGEILSPDGRWFASVRDDNLWLRSAADSRTVALTEDGVPDMAWAPRARRRSFTFVPQQKWAWWSPWSPDGRWLAAKKVDYTGVPSFPIVDWLSSDYDIEWIRTDSASGQTWQDELHLLDVDSGQQVHV